MACDYLRVIYLGSFLKVKDILFSYEIIESNTFILSESNISLVIILPITKTQQIDLLKFSEEAQRHIILYMAEYVSLIEPLKSRYILKSDTNFAVNLSTLDIHKSLYGYWLEFGYLNKALAVISRELK